MLYYLLAPLGKTHLFFNLFTYISFRAAGAMVTALLGSHLRVGPWIIAKLRAHKVGQVIRAEGMATHQVKRGTPTMGGLIIIASTVIPTLLWAPLNNRFIVVTVIAMLWTGAIGFVDDYLKVVEGRSRGLVAKWKLVAQVLFGVTLGVMLLIWPVVAVTTVPASATTVPFFKYLVVVFAPPVYVLFVTGVVTGFSNAVNLTDGLDGLATGLSIIAAAAFAFFAYVLGRVDATGYLNLFYLPGSGELAVFCAALMGGCLGFLWFNAHPAEVIMGDTGSLAIGGSFGTLAILLKSEFLLVIIGGVFVVEALSVMIQIGTYKYFRRTRGREYADSHRVFLDGADPPSLRETRLEGADGGGSLLDLRDLLRAGRDGHAQAAMSRIDDWRASGREVSVAGMARSGTAAARLLHAEGIPVYLSDAGRADELVAAAQLLRDDLGTAVTVETGGHDLDRIAASAALVLSPGIPPAAAVVAAAASSGVPIVAEAQLGLDAMPDVPEIVVTGTNGKTTTTALVEHLLRVAGRRTVAAGNIGNPLSAVAMVTPLPEWLAVELSSFQLHDCPDLAPAVGVLTNLAPDHLDRYLRHLRGILCRQGEAFCQRRFGVDLGEQPGRFGVAHDGDACPGPTPLVLNGAGYSR